METPEQIKERRNDNWHTITELVNDGNSIVVYNVETKFLKMRRGRTVTVFQHSVINGHDCYKPYEAYTR